MSERLEDKKYQNVSIIGLAVLLWAGWTVLLAISLTLNMRQASTAIFKLAEIEAETHFNKDTVYRRWAAFQGGLYVPVSDFTPANPYLSHVEERDIVTPSGRRLTLVNPAYMTRQVHELGAEQYGVRGHLTSLKPVRPETKPDEWETEALLAFEKGVKEIKSLDVIDGKPYLRFMRPFMTEAGCLKCHGHQGYNVGDVRGGVSVSVPMENYYGLRNSQYRDLILWHMLIFLVGSLTLLLGLSKLKKKEIENQAAWQRINLDRDRFSSLLEISKLRYKTEEDLIRFALEEFVRLTKSKLGYFHFYDEESRNIRLYAWCQNTIKQCQIKEFGTIYPLEQAGVWAESIRLRRPVIHNDYQKLPGRKGSPEGHLPIERHLNVPVMDGGHIIGIAGVGNKETAYDDVDATQLSLFSNTMWEIVKNIRSLDEIREKEKDLLLFRALVDQAYDPIYIISPADAHFLDTNNRACEVLGYSREELLLMGVLDIDVGLPKGFSWEEHIKELRRLPNLLLESVHKRKDGTTFPVEINVRVFTLDDREYMVAAVRDISERKRAEEEMARHRDNLEELIRDRTLGLEQKTAELEKSRQALQYLLEDVTEAKNKTEEKVAEIERMNRIFIDRELRMVELKNRIKELEKNNGTKTTDKHK